MGSYISIGFVFNELNFEQIKNKLRKLVNLLIANNGQLKEMKFSKDIEGMDWVEYSFKNNILTIDLIESLAINYFGELKITSDFLKIGNLNIIVNVEKEKSYFGFLLEISEAELLKTHNSEEIKFITDKVIDFMIDAHDILDYAYAFCDNEAEIEYSPQEIVSFDRDVYSIIIFYSSKKQKEYYIKKSKWNIDGLTSRE